MFLIVLLLVFGKTARDYHLVGTLQTITRAKIVVFGVTTKLHVQAIVGGLFGFFELKIVLSVKNS